MVRQYSRESEIDSLLPITLDLGQTPYGSATHAMRVRRSDLLLVVCEHLLLIKPQNDASLWIDSQLFAFPRRIRTELKAKNRWFERPAFSRHAFFRATINVIVLIGGICISQDHPCWHCTVSRR